MIEQLASPSVCVIDDERDDYEPILAALNALFVSAIHIRGDLDSLPPHTFQKLRLVFLDLHLSAMTGKDAASHTANAFRRIVSTETAPVVVVVWSKYANDKVHASGTPPEDQETEAQLFKRTLLEAEPAYSGRLVFVHMAKPLPDARPDDWVGQLKEQIAASLVDQPAIEALWAWDAMVKNGCFQISSGLTAAAQVAVQADGASLADGLKAAMQTLVHAEGESNLTEENAPFHLATALSQLLVDQLEHADGLDSIITHGRWLANRPAIALGPDFVGRMNSFLLAADLPVGGSHAPGTVYRVDDISQIRSLFGRSPFSMLSGLCSDRFGTDRRRSFTRAVSPVFVEISPVCDVAQDKRLTALFVGGVVVPATTEFWKSAKRTADNVTVIPSFPMKFRIRWPTPRFPEQDVFMILNHTFKVGLRADARPTWLMPWFRLRELPTTAIRNANSAHAARVGYVAVS